MKLSRPKVITFWISVALGVLGLLGEMKALAFLSPYAFWLALAGLVLLALGNMLKGL